MKEWAVGNVARSGQLSESADLEQKQCYRCSRPEPGKRVGVGSPAVKTWVHKAARCS